MSIDYAPYLGINSTAAAVVFAVLYAPLLVFYTMRAVRWRTQIYITLALFCAIRITSFSIRAALAQSASAGSNLGLVIAYGVLAAIGFFGLLYSAYTLIVDRQLLLGPDAQHGLLTRIFHERRVVRLILTVAIALGIAGSDMAYSTNPGTLQTSRTLREASVYIFLAMTVLVAVQALQMAIGEFNYPGKREGPFGARHGILVLAPIVLLLLVREAFAAGTVRNPAQADKEALWYPLSALPELLAVLLFAAPGLVPSRAALVETTEMREQGAGARKRWWA